MDFIYLLSERTWCQWNATEHSTPVEVCHVERRSAEGAFTKHLLFLSSPLLVALRSPALGDPDRQDSKYHDYEFRSQFTSARDSPSVRTAILPFW